ncbi:hypothetical protein DFQ28_004735 [Apophysomyces sp. BC1034]|nr:hypothetical protein DFQ28_004735 [Apophysomyces sp. BC1034]
MENTIPKSYEEAFRDLQSSPVGSITILRKILQAFREEIKLHTLPQVMQQSAAIQRMASDILTASRDLDDACVQLQEAINQDDTRAQQLEEPLYSPVPELPDKSSSYLAMGNPRTPMFAPIQDIQDEAQYSVIPSPSSSQLNISDGAPMNLDIRDNAMTPQHTPKISSPNFPATNSPPSPPSGVQPVIAEALSYAQPLQSDCYIETEMCSGMIDTVFHAAVNLAVTKNLPGILEQVEPTLINENLSAIDANHHEVSHTM